MTATSETAEYAYAQKLEAAGNLSVTLYPLTADCDDEPTVIVDTINGIDSEMFTQAFLDAVELTLMQRGEERAIFKQSTATQTAFGRFYFYFASVMI